MRNNLLGLILKTFIQSVNQGSFKFELLFVLLKQIQIMSIWMDLMINILEIQEGSIIEFIAIFYRFSRPYSFYTRIIYIWCGVFLINTIMLLFHPLYFVFKYDQNNQLLEKTINECFRQQNSIIRIIYNLQSIYYKVIIQNFILLFIEISIIEIQHFIINKQSTDLLPVIFCFISIIIVITNYIIYYVFIGSSLSIFHSQSQLLYQSYSNILEPFILVLFPILYISDNTNQNIFILISLIIITYLIIKLYDLIYHYQSAHLQNQYWQIIVITINLSLISTILILEQQFRFNGSIIFITIPLFIYLALLQKKQLITITLVSNSTNPYRLQLRQILFSRKQTKLQSLFNKLQIINHRKYCQFQQCPCYENANIQEEDQLKILNQEFFEAILQSSKDQSILFQHYITFMQYLDQNTQAISQIRYVLNEQQFQLQKNLSQYRKSIHSSSQSQSQKQSQFFYQPQKQIQLNYIDNLKLEILEEISQGCINNNLQGSKDDTEQAILLFLQSEEKSKFIWQQTLRSINLKREFFSQLLEQRIQSNLDQIFMTALNIVKQYRYIQQYIEDEYKRFPSQKLQSANAFFQAEILSDYQKAYNIQSLNSVNEEKLFNIHKKISLDLFSNKINYLIIDINPQLDMEITQRSNFCHQIFEYDQQIFSRITDASQLLPVGFANTHKSVIQEFLETGASKFYKETNTNYILGKNGFINAIEFFFDTNKKSLKNFSVITFFVPNESARDGVIFVNNNKRIGGINKQFFRQLGFNSKQINQVPIFQLYKCQISKLLPNFKQQSSFSTFITQKDSEQSSFIKFFQKEIFEQKTNFDSKPLPWGNEQLINTYSSSIKVNRGQVNDAGYYIIQISNIRLNDQSTYNTVMQQQYLEEKVFDISHLDVLSEQQVEGPKAIIQLINEENISDDLTMNRCYFNVQNVQQEYDNQLDNKMKSSINNQQKQIPRTDETRINLGMTIFSPKDSFVQLIEKNTSKNKQQFFATNQEQQTFSLDHSNIQQQQVQPTDNKNDGIKNQIEQQLKYEGKEDKNIQQEFQQDIQSQVSSIAGFKRSRFYRKYELYSRLIEGTKHLNIFQYIIALYIIIIMICFIHNIMVIVYANEDLTRFIQEIDMLSIKSQINGPMQNFLITLLSITDYYLNILSYRTKTLAQSAQSMSYSYYAQNQSFYILKENYQIINQNPFISQFFQGEYVQLTLQKGIRGIETTNVTLQQGISQIYFNSFQFQLLRPDFYIFNGTNWPWVTFFVGNTIIFTNKFNNLTNEIQQYSLNRADIISEKWLHLLVPIIVIISILQIITIICFYLYRQRFKFFISMISNQDSRALNYDLVRLKIIQEFIEKDKNLIYCYQFDIDAKEAFINKYYQAKTQREYDKKLRDPNLINYKVPILGYLATNLFLYSVFLLIVILLNYYQQDYLVKYKPSIIFYVQLSNTSIAAGGAFQGRQMQYYINGNSFFFLNNSDSVFQQEQVNNYIQNMKTYYQETVNIDGSKILSTQSFMNSFNKLKSGDICDLLSKQDYVQAQYHCQNDLQGIISRGLQITLNTIVNNLQNEYLINNYTSRTQASFNELEVSLIIYSVLKQIILDYKNNLSEVTDQLKSQLMVFFYNLLIKKANCNNSYILYFSLISFSVQDIQILLQYIISKDKKVYMFSQLRVVIFRQPIRKKLKIIYDIK